MKKEYILFVILVSLGIVYWTRHRPAKDTAPVTRNPASEIQMLPAKSAPTPQPRPADLTPSEHGRMMALGIRQSVLPSKNATNLQVQFKKKMLWCTVGDLDFIKVQSVSPDQPEWRLSLEQDSSVASVKLSLQDIMEGRKLSLNFPKKDGVYALYLCKNTGSGSCLSQALWNPKQRSTRKLAGVVMNAQGLVRQDGRIMVLPTDNWSRASIEQLKDALRAQGLSDYKRLDELYKTVGTLKPLAAQFDGQTLSIPIAMNDPKCL